MTETISPFRVAQYWEAKHGQANLRSLTDELFNSWSFTNINKKIALRKVRWTDAMYSTTLSKGLRPCSSTNRRSQNEDDITVGIKEYGSLL